MIRISGRPLQETGSLSLTRMERSIVKAKESSPVTYNYPSKEALVYEMQLRSKIVEAANDLNASYARFAPFRESFANPRYWTRTPNGGFRLRGNVQPADGIRDIFEHGEYYGFECSTAIMILFYKAVLEMIGDEEFNKYFRNLYLRDWHASNYLPLVITEDKNEAYLGDGVYFENPDFDPQGPEWRGENAIVMGPNVYFGHGIGLKSAEEILADLNEKRKPFSTREAFQADLVVHPDFEFLRNLSSNGNAVQTFAPHAWNPFVAQIGSQTTYYY